MKTKNACFWIFLLLSGSAYAQMSQKGTVQIFNSNKSPLPGVQLTATDAPATDTDANGNFQFNFSKQKPGMAIASPNVYKKGYELVNKDMINGWILSEKRPLSIVMAPEGTIEESKSKYYSISVAHFSKKQEKAIEEINQLYIAQKISLQERSDRLKAMAEESRSFMNQIDQYAEKFARINPDDINAIEKQVLELVNAGKLSEAIELYNKSGIITQAREKLLQKTKAEEDIDKLAEIMYRYADLCALTGGMENEKKANDAYKFVAEALPDRFTYVFKYALQKIGLEDSDTMEWLDKCQKLSFDEKSLVQVLNIKSTLARHHQKDYIKALEYDINALEILSNKNISMPSGDYYAIYHQTFYSMGKTYEAMNEFKEAKEIYEDQIKEISEEIADSDNQLFINIQSSQLANIYSSLTDIYKKEGNVSKVNELSEKLFELNKKNAGDNEEAILEAEIGRQEYLFHQAVEKADYKLAAGSIKEILAKAEKLYKMRPLSRAYWYALWNFAYISVSTETEPENFLTTIKAFEDKVANELKINSEEQKTSLLYNIEKQYILYYSKNGNKPEERKHVEQAYQYAEKLNQLNPARFVLEIISAQASYIDMLLELSEHDKALKAAIDLEALYTMQGVWGFQDLRTENSIGTAMVCGGLYELGVEHLEKVKKDREKHLKQKPNDVDMMGSITTTYNNLSLGYGKLKKYAKALEVQKKAYEIIKTLYPHNKAQLGTNYLLMTLNTSIAYYQNSNNAEALKFLQEAENIANELKELNQLFSSYPLVVRFAKGDLLAKLSQPGSKELLKTGLEYKSGTLPNDAVLLYLINDYRTNNNSIYRK